MMKRTLLILAALLGLISVSSSQCENLGRLFFTPEQRDKLGSAKFQHEDSGDDVESLTINGIVQKHGGKRTVWINGVPQMAGKSDERAPESFPLDVPGVNRPVRVKVGQKVMVDVATDADK